MENWISAVQKANQAGKFTDSAKANILRWLEIPRYNAFRDEIGQLIGEGNWEALNDAFYQMIPFGTGGRRGQVGVGTNRMNEATVAESAQGVANKLKKEISSRKPKVVIAYDTRLTSPQFTHTCASVLAANDIDVFLFDGPRATPELSFMIRYLGCDAGIVISASHNPPEDNGFKAYWTDGGQVVPPRDAELIEEVKNVSEVAQRQFEESYALGLIHRLGPEHDNAYHEAVIAQALTDYREVKIVYSPLHGTGVTSISPILRKAGFKDVHLVEHQKDPDGRFPNVPGHKPNPEVTTGLDAAISLAKAIGADLAMVSDPDADRLSCAVPSADDSDFVILSGNQCSALMMDFICSQQKEKGSLKATDRVYSTIVSSPLMPTVARANGLTVKDDLLVGFKWIAEQIEALSNPDDFLFGSEESIGFMKGPQTRDKDGAIAALIFSELAAYLKLNGASVLDKLDDIYKEHGYFHDLGTSIFLEGAKGSERMQRILDVLRNNPPAEIGGHAILSIIDRLKGEKRSPDGTVLATIDGPTNNLLIFQLDKENKSWIAIRPSGTEPKIKFYFSYYQKVDGELATVKASAKATVEALMKATTDMAMAIE